jgi:hypothetical protein
MEEKKLTIKCRLKGDPHRQFDWVAPRTLDCLQAPRAAHSLLNLRMKGGKTLIIKLRLNKYPHRQLYSVDLQHSVDLR